MEGVGCVCDGVQFYRRWITVFYPIWLTKEMMNEAGT